MSVIWTSRTRTKQPQGVVRVAGTALARGLRAAIIPQQGLRDSVTGQLWTTWGTAPVITAGRHGLAFDNTAAFGGLMLSPSSTVATASQTHILLVETTAVSGAYAGLVATATADGTSGSLSFQRDGGNIEWMGFGGSIGNSLGPSATAFGPTCLVVTGTASVITAYRDGVAQTPTSAQSVASQADSRIVLFGERAANAGYSTKAKIYGYWGFGRALSAAEVAQIGANPWQLFAPERRPLVFGFAAAGGGTTVAVPAGALTMTGYAPTVSFTAHQTVAVPAGALTLAAFAPTVSTSASQTVSVPLASLSLTGFAPTINFTAHQTISVPAAALTMTGYAPTIGNSANTAISVPSGTLSLTGYAPTVGYTANQSISIPAGALVFTGYAPTVVGGASSIWTQVSAASGTWTPQ